MKTINNNANEEYIHSCEGSCESHEDGHALVHVTDPKTGYDWGKFTYCANAIAEDINRGLNVTVIGDIET